MGAFEADEIAVIADASIQFLMIRVIGVLFVTVSVDIVRIPIRPRFDRERALRASEHIRFCHAGVSVSRIAKSQWDGETEPWRLLSARAAIPGGRRASRPRRETGREVCVMFFPEGLVRCEALI